MDLGINGKKALVCAASKGIGKAAAKALAEAGVELFLCARGEDELTAAAAEIGKLTDKPVHFMSADLTNKDSRENLVKGVHERFSAIDILVHNVGGPKPSTVQETELEDWRKGFDQLFESVVHLNQAFLPGMKINKWGRIVTVTSLSVMEPIGTIAVSNAMRSAVTAMLKTLADEVAAENITVNCVAPGVIYTDRTEERVNALMAEKGGTKEQYLQDYVKSIPAKRLGTPEEMGATIAFLASQPAAYITGSTICVDGGKRRSTY